MLAAEGLKDIVALSQHPLARVNDSFAFCHHGGWYECAMQTHALCAKQLKPSEPFAMYDFIDCNFGNLGKKDADNNRLCTANASVAYDTMWSCATGYGPKSGPGLLLESALLADKLHVHAAPTVFIDGKQLPGVPQPADLLKAVCDAYTGPKPTGCAHPLPTAVEEESAVTAAQVCHV